jgi:hypothetical protein
MSQKQQLEQQLEYNDELAQQYREQEKHMEMLA